MSAVPGYRRKTLPRRFPVKWYVTRVAKRPSTRWGRPGRAEAAVAPRPHRVPAFAAGIVGAARETGARGGVIFDVVGTAVVGRGPLRQLRSVLLELPQLPRQFLTRGCSDDAHAVHDHARPQDDPAEF